MRRKRREYTVGRILVGGYVICKESQVNSFIGSVVKLTIKCVFVKLDRIAYSTISQTDPRYQYISSFELGESGKLFWHTEVQFIKALIGLTRASLRNIECFRILVLVCLMHLFN